MNAPKFLFFGFFLLSGWLVLFISISDLFSLFSKSPILSNLLTRPIQKSKTISSILKIPDYHFKPFSGQCEMTFMWPNYIKVPPSYLFDKNGKARKNHSTFSSTALRSNFFYSQSIMRKYSLFLYREGALQQNSFQPQALKGIPILFIPGNAGNYKQARSVGKELHQVSLQAGRAEDLFDLFSIDFDDELTAFSSQLILDQAHFINTCVDTILRKFYGPRSPHVSDLIVIAHSMAGISVRAAMRMDDYVPGSIKTVITLSSPLRSHPLQLDGQVARLYELLSQENNEDRNSSTADLALLSISAGFNDVLVHSDLTTRLFPSASAESLSVSLYSMPAVGISADHLSILWCNQVVKTLAEAIANLASQQGRTNSPRERLAALKEILVGRYQYLIILVVVVIVVTITITIIIYLFIYFRSS